MHDRSAVVNVQRLAASGLGATAIARETGLSRSTVRDWIAGREPRNGAPPIAWPITEDEARDLPPSYAYLLGVYLGDGCISTHPRGVYSLRITVDAKYPGIVGECRAAIQEMVPRNRVGEHRRRGNYTASAALTTVDVYAYWKQWPRVFPQHGPGKKNQRSIQLTPWQWDLVAERPFAMLRGLIHSDGCRFMNTGTNWRCPRYVFSNTSEDILRIFDATCDIAGVHHTRAPRAAYVSRKCDVHLLDRFIGPKR